MDSSGAAEKQVALSIGQASWPGPGSGETSMTLSQANPFGPCNHRTAKQRRAPP